MGVERVYADVDFIGSSFYLLTYRSVLLDDLNRILFLWIWVFCLPACLRHVSSAHGGQKGAAELLGLGLEFCQGGN